jgi:hypothetical protein
MHMTAGMAPELQPTRKRDRIGEMVEAMIANSHAEEMADYLSRGRKHEQLADADLQRDFLAAFEVWVPLNAARPQTPRDRAALTKLNDFTAEIRLRGREPPYHLSPEMCAQMGRTLKKYDGESDPGVRAAIREFLDKWDRPN